MSSLDLDLDAIRAQVYQRLGLEHDEEAAARDITDPDEIVVDLSGQIRSDRDRAESAATESGSESGSESESVDTDDQTDPSAIDVDAGGEGSEGAGETAPTDPAPSDVTEEGRGLPPEVAEARADLTAAPTEPEVVVDPKAHTLDEPTPAPAADQPAPAPSDASDASPRFDYNRYFETLYGEVPPVEQVESILTFVQQVNSVPVEHQQIISAIVEGQFDPVAYANYVMQQAGQTPVADPDDPDTWGTPAPRQPDPHVARLEAELAQIRQREIARYQQEVVSGVDAAMTDFRRSNPHITEEQFRALAQQVNGQRGWRAEVEAGTNARDAYLRHLTATALADRRFAQTIAPPTPVASTPAAPSPDPRPRQAANAAIAGTNSPAAPNPGKRRSPLGNGTPTTPGSRPKNREELRAALAAGVAEMTGRD